MLESNPGLLRLWQSDAIGTRLDLIHSRLDLVHTRLDLIHTRLDLIHYYKMPNGLSLSVFDQCIFLLVCGFFPELGFFSQNCSIHTLYCKFSRVAWAGGGGAQCPFLHVNKLNKRAPVAQRRVARSKKPIS
jgi:hypothetical protein